MFQDAVGWFLLTFGVSSIIMSLSWLAFARLSMARIERQIQDNGLPRPAPWDGVGARALWYASAIILPVGIWNRADDPLIDVPLVRQYATRLDRLLGVALMVSGLFFLAVGLIGGWFFDIY